MEVFSQDVSSKSRELKAKMEDLKAQLARCQEEYNRAKQEEFREAVRRFLDEFNIRTIEDLNNAAMKLRGMRPEIVKEAARSIRENDIPAATASEPKPEKKTYFMPSEEPDYSSRKIAPERKPAADKQVETFFDDTVKESPSKPAMQRYTKEINEAVQRDKEMDLETTGLNLDSDKPVEPEKSVEEPVAQLHEEENKPAVVSEPDEKTEAPERDELPAKKEDDFDLSDDDLDMNWDFGDDDEDKEEPEPEAVAEDSHPVEEKQSDVPLAGDLSDEDIEQMADKLENIVLSDDQIAALRNKAVVVRAANKLSKALFTAEKELDTSMPQKDVCSLYDYDSATMQGTNIRAKYQAADKMISVLDKNITEDNAPQAYGLYTEFKDFPDFIRNRAMTLVAKEIEEYFA